MSFWSHILPNPSSLRRQLLAIGATLALTAIAGAVALKPSKRKPDSWDVFKRDVSQRALVDVFDDFQSGLDSWESVQNLSTWSYDLGGLVIPGKLSLLTPSLPLTDYNVDTVAQLVDNGLGIAFRASGLRTYEAIRLIVDGSGPMPPLMLERYSVINGTESAHVRVHCPATFQKDTMYRIHLEVQGEFFTLYIQDHLIDSWSNGRLKSGGVGFFCGPGERARVAYVRVSHNTDTAGRFCAFLADHL